MPKEDERVPSFVRSVSKKRLSMSYQVHLPRLPVPELQETLERYLLCVKPIVPDVQFQKTRILVEEFGCEGSVGRMLQRHLEERAKKEVNWADEWWLNDMYLNNQAALPVNSNPGMVLPMQKFETLEERLRFTAKLIDGIVDYKEILDTKSLPVDVARGQLAGQPLCMQQYYRLLSSYRLPGRVRDTLMSVNCRKLPEHVIIAMKNRFFAVNISTDEGARLSEEEILHQIERVFSMVKDDESVDVMSPVGILTSLDRSSWADVRTELLKSPVNRESLLHMEECIALICLDVDMGQSVDDVNLAYQMLHGGGPNKNSCNRWYDKTIQFVVGSNGAVGLCYEHSPSEGIAVISLVEHLLKHISRPDHIPHYASSLEDLPLPKQLVWEEHNAKVTRYIELAKTASMRMSNNLDLNVLRFKEYGKDFIKKQNISPDAYIQVALQLTFYKIYGHLVSTYESASTRRFREGRVDNIRAATVQALDFAKSVTNADGSANIKLDGRKMALLRRAIKAQTDFTIATISGHGIDCHLVGLREMAKELNLPIPDIFKDPSFDICNYFTLSTSQIPTNTDSFMCYGAVVEDGYGVSYNPHSDNIVFCTSSFRSCPSTCSEKFANALVDSLQLMKKLCHQWNRRRSSSLEAMVVPRQLSIHRQMSPRSYSVDSDDLRMRMKALGIRNRTVEALPEEGSEDNGIKKPRIHAVNHPRITCLYSRRRSGGILVRERMHHALSRKISSDRIHHGKLTTRDATTTNKKKTYAENHA